MPNRPRRMDDADELLAAERAGTEYWRDVARQRRVEAARVQRRPIVRVAVAVDRRTARLQAGAVDAMRAAGRAGRRVALVAGALQMRSERDARHARLDAQVAAADGTDTTRSDGPDAPPVAVIELTEPIDADEVAVTVDDADTAVICLVAPTARPLGTTWLRHLVDAIGNGVVAATPQVVHPARPWTEASPHDLLVRWCGLDLAVDDEGAPRLVARDAGRRPDASAPEVEVAAAATVVAVDREAWQAAGGLTDGLDVDAALVDLCARLRASGGTVVAVPSALVVDERPVTRRADLTGPVPPDRPGWATVVDRHGPALVRSAAPSRGRPGGALRPPSIALTTATPSAKMAPLSGDWHYAGFFADALRRAGHRVRRQTLDQADSLAGRSADVHVVLRGLEPVRRTSGQAHVLWVISHPEALDVVECDEADLILVASHRYADHLRRLTDTPVEVFLQATEPRQFRPLPPDPTHRHPLTIVANSRGVLRSAVADAAAAGLTPAVYGMGWEGLVAAPHLRATYVPIDALPAVYASADLVLNDHWETMRRWGFLSNRVLDVAACGTPVASDHLPEVAEVFGDLVPTWDGPTELAALVSGVLGDLDAARERAAEARAVVLGAHTFDHRVAELADHLSTHDLGQL